jgi:hypothetical protein
MLLGRPRPAYRFYSEEEYLTGADERTFPQDLPVQIASREHCLRRLVGLLAVTGAVGIAGGLIAAASLRAHSSATRILAGRAARTRARRTQVAAPAAARAQTVHREPAREPAHRISRTVVRPAGGGRADIPRRTAGGSGRRAFTAAGPSAPGASNRGAPLPRTPGEFGFER